MLMPAVADSGFQSMTRKDGYNTEDNSNLSSMLYSAPLDMDWGMDKGDLFDIADDLLPGHQADWFLIPPVENTPEITSKLNHVHTSKQQYEPHFPREENMMLMNLDSLHSDDGDSDSNPSLSGQFSLDDTDTSSDDCADTLDELESRREDFPNAQEETVVTSRPVDVPVDNSELPGVAPSPESKRKASEYEDEPSETPSPGQSENAEVEDGPRRTSVRVRHRRQERERVQQQEKDDEAEVGTSGKAPRGKGRKAASQQTHNKRAKTTTDQKPLAKQPGSKRMIRVNDRDEDKQIEVVEEVKAVSKAPKSAPKGVRRKKDKNLPRKGRTAFILFLLDFRAKNKQENNTPEAFSVLSKRVGIAWSTLPDTERAKYIRRGAQEAAQYKREKAAYLAKKAVEDSEGQN